MSGLLSLAFREAAIPVVYVDVAIIGSSKKLPGWNMSHPGSAPRLRKPKFKIFIGVGRTFRRCDTRNRQSEYSTLFERLSTNASANPPQTVNFISSYKITIYEIRNTASTLFTTQVTLE